jgi:large subunit ribosomal protein L24
MSMMRIRRNDTVQVITGKDKGKRGTVLEVNQGKGLVKVAGIAIVTKHMKARRQGETPSIKRQEAFLHLSNVMLVSSADSKPTRVGIKVQEDGTKVRMSKRTQQVL